MKTSDVGETIPGRGKRLEGTARAGYRELRRPRANAIAQPFGIERARSVRAAASLVRMLVPMLVVGSATAQEAEERKSSRIGIELGASALARNDVRVPGDGGTRFDMIDLVGKDAKPFFRISAEWALKGRHGMGIAVAPFEISGTGRLSSDTAFASERFSAGTVQGEYEFNVVKVSYRYALEPRGNWHWNIGFTGLIRDANIALRQGLVSANEDNVGFAPLFHTDAEYRFPGSWRLRLDFDGLAGGPGRAFDVAFKASYDAGEHWQVGAGYRALEGGVNTADVYNFAWVNYLLLDVGYRF